MGFTEFADMVKIYQVADYLDTDRWFVRLSKAKTYYVDRLEGRSQEKSNLLCIRSYDVLVNADLVVALLNGERPFGRGKIVVQANPTVRIG